MTINSTTFTPFTAFTGVGAVSDAAAATGTTDTTGTTGATGTSSSSDGVDTLAANGTSSVYGLSTDDFMKLFLAQLQNQDPTKPMDDSQMLNELSQMTQVQTLQQVQTALQGSQLAQSSALIGKNVTGVDVAGATVDGVVTSVVQSTDAGLVLQVGSQYIKPDSVTAVTTPAASGTTGTTA
jgi:flagellar basal-body rod modification protein FlgD